MMTVRKKKKGDNRKKIHHRSGKGGKRSVEKKGEGTGGCSIKSLYLLGEKKGRRKKEDHPIIFLRTLGRGERKGGRGSVLWYHERGRKKRKGDKRGRVCNWKILSFLASDEAKERGEGNPMKEGRKRNCRVNGFPKRGWGGRQPQLTPLVWRGG